MRHYFLFFSLLCGLAAAPHGVTLTWTDTLNPPATTYNMYRLNGACPGTPTGFTKLTAAPIAVKTYEDPYNGGTAILACYYVTAFLAGATPPESAPSAMVAVNATTPIDPPTNVTAVVH